MARQDFRRSKRLGLASWILLGSAALALTSCGAHSATSAPPASPTSQRTPQGTAGERLTLTCAIATAPQGIDTVALTLTCEVTDAPADDTAFTLDYSASSSTGSPHHFAPACSGALNNGHGVCTQRYVAPVTEAIGKGVVAGMTEPDQRALGPVTPRQTPTASSQTPGGGPHPTFVP